VALAERGQHRAASLPDLLIAATGELAQLTVLHHDKDFDLIATSRVNPPNASLQPEHRDALTITRVLGGRGQAPR